MSTKDWIITISVFVILIMALGFEGWFIWKLYRIFQIITSMPA